MSEKTVSIKKGQRGNVRLLMWLLENKSLVLLVAICIASGIISGGVFFRGENISTVLRQTAITSLLSMGYVFVLTCGMIDLSVGHMLSLACVVYAQVSLVAPVWVAMIAAIATGFACGIFNGLLSIKLNLIPFVLTLGTAQMFRGVAYLLCDGISINITDATMKYVGQGILFGFLPMTVVIVLVVTAIIAVVVYRMKYGRHVLATGGNPEAARVSGVNIHSTKIIAFIIMGVMVGIASLVLVGRVAIAMPNSGQNMEMDAIAATIIGGTSLSGGKTSVIGAIFGALILGVISNLLNLAGLSSFWQWFFKGVIIVAAILLDSVTEKIFKKRQLA
jgi:ribose transport system permease protein